MVGSSLFLMQEGVGLIASFPENYDIERLLEYVIKADGEGGLLLLSGCSGFHLSHEAVAHMENTKNEIHLYSHKTVNGLCMYMGKVVLELPILGTQHDDK